MKTSQITILSGKNEESFSLRNGLRLDALNAKYKTSLEFSCRKANCGICLFKVLEGHGNLSKIETKEETFLQAMKVSKDERLACQCRVYGPIKIEVEVYS